MFSNSFGSSFPDQDFGDWEAPLPDGVQDRDDLNDEQWEESRDAWYALDDDTQWGHSVAGLVDYRRLDPADLYMAFGHGLTVMDLHSPSWEQCLDIVTNR